MNEWLKLSKKRRIEILEQVNNRLGLPVQAIEKDWWVTMVLKAVFSSKFAEHFVFKGGTSLSKAYYLIDRFSEDIDLAIKNKILSNVVQGLKELGKESITDEIRQRINQALEKVPLEILKEEILHAPVSVRNEVLFLNNRNK